ncbi:uncharacterized protein N7496_003992 [Penicillium cataractarum]|uniref:Uncharacterized protein n=1 Tax=Penicillium cataractarum TaxID=2100454 RepID=A0A9W9VI31_9EURO|nr:uncharacterized protein N7496_003992 [Penicillium cataractarum]KAJ5381564.1 hypothetical protein N7496_003992 [Penicillium cataractarum]
MPMQNRSYELVLGSSFLKDLPPSIKRFPYHGVSDFFDILESESARFEVSPHASESLLFHASKETIDTLFDLENEDTPPIAKYLTSFDTNEQLFLDRMPSAPHGGAPFAMHGNADVRAESRGKQPDCGWVPSKTTRGVPRSPSVTLEVAFSENDFKLNSDVRFWLNPDEGKANVCLTLQIGRSQPEIRIEKWENQNDRIHRSQVIWITKRGNQINVSHHPLVISFDSLFCRPSSCPREKDVELSQQQLKEVAEMIWEHQSW